MQEQLWQEIIEKVQASETTDTVHYLSHHAVIHRDKQTTKLRMRLQETRACLLNKCLFARPKFNQSIPDILLGFRMYSIALVADVEKAFLMVSVRAEDHDFCGWMTLRNHLQPFRRCVLQG